MNKVQHELAKVFHVVAKPCYLSFNIHASQLYDAQLINYIHQLHQGFGSNVNIVLEIVERSPRFFDSCLVANMDSLRDIGIRFAIDDFDPMSSPLTRFDYSGFSFIKLDRSIVQVSENRLVYQHLINRMISMSQDLGLHLIVEGVELEVQRRFLNDCGVVDMQGYLFQRPMPLEQFFFCYQ